MGVLDFLSDLSKARSKDELGLGGMRSLLGTRGAAPQGKRGDEMMSRTSSDSLPGYFDPETREYVPWYVDLFDGGGLNKSEGLLSDAQKVTTAVDMLNTKRAPVQRAGQMATGSDMPNTGMTGIPGYTLPQSDMPNTGMTGIPGYTLPQSDMPNTGMTGIPGYTLPQSPSSRTPELPQVRDQFGEMFVNEDGKWFDKELYEPDYNLGMRFRDNRIDEPPTIAMPQEPTVPSLPNMSTPAPRNSTLGTLRENVYSVGPIEAYRNALNNRPDIPLTQPYAGGDDTPRLSEMQTPMMQHPAFPQFVDIMKRTGNESVLQDPSQASFVFNNYLKQIGY